MKDLDALVKVYRMAYHANDLGGRPWTDEEREALGTTRRYIENNFPIGIRTVLWDVDRGYFDITDERTAEQRKPGSDHVPIGGAGNGA